MRESCRTTRETPREQTACRARAGIANAASDGTQLAAMCLVRSLSVIVGAKDDHLRHWLVSTLEDMRAETQEAFSGWDLLRLLSMWDKADLAIIDVRLPSPGALRTLALARTIGIDAPFLLVADPADFDVRVAAARLGAHLLARPLSAAALARGLQTTAKLIRPRSGRTIH